MALALLTYDPRDPSLDTAIDMAPHNFLGHDGAVVADLLRQGFGLAAFLIPAALLGWSFRLLLDRPLRGVRVKLALLPPALLLGSLALSVLDAGAPPPGPAVRSAGACTGCCGAPGSTPSPCRSR